jgi:hypothetical protein
MRSRAGSRGSSHERAASRLAGPRGRDAGRCGLAGCATTGAPRGIPDKARVLVVGGGWGGATAAKYVRLLSDHRIEVVLVEPADTFVSCPLSNLVIGGSRTLADSRRRTTGSRVRTA